MSEASERPWLLDPDVTFLNHGSFGSCPRPVLARQQALQHELEREPVAFMVEEVPRLLDQARAALGAFLGAAPEDLAFVPNATYGVNAVLRSLSWSPGDEILTTDHTYNACANALRFLEARDGVKVKVAKIPFPLTSTEQVLEAVTAAVTPQTKLALLDHITSSTALVFPLRRLVAALAAKGVETLVDGAHAPGMVALDVPHIGAAYYTGNCHKWVCAPKGTAFLWVSPARRDMIRPLSISHGANEPLVEGGRSRFHLEFDWTGTIDYSPYLSLPTALAWMARQHPDGWEGVRRQNRALALEARALICDALEIPAPAPDEMIGSIASMPLPSALTLQSESQNLVSSFATSQVQKDLQTKHKIQVPIFFWPDHQHQLLRISAQLYNSIDDYQKLAAALKAMVESA